jgi:starvation-inducible DNA-binding protein
MPQKTQHDVLDWHDGRDIQMDIGIEATKRQEVADALVRVLAHHWNVTGPLFDSLHRLFEEQYQGLWTAIDELAERIRSLGHPAPGTHKLMSRLSSIKERDEVLPASAMVRDLLDGHETTIRTCRDAAKVAEDANDEGTFDILVQRMQEHEKTAWMLRSLIQ